jgi:hypothetical protein
MTTVGTVGSIGTQRSTVSGQVGERVPNVVAPGRDTRRHLQVALGILWLLDGLLQLQPFMLSRRFATQVIAPAASGQPAWVAWPVHQAAATIGAHAVVADLLFAFVQLVLGIGFLHRRSVRVTVVASVVWAAGVWFFGEGLGGLAGGTSSLLSGAPGAVALYAVLALAAWPGGAHRDGGQTAEGPRPVPSWFPVAWAAIWLDLALVALLPANRSVGAVRSQVDGSAGPLPGWLSHVDRAVGAGVGHAGIWTIVLLAAGPAAIGLLGLGTVRQRRAAAWCGIGLASAAWVVGQSFGLLFSGSATDPNTGPLLALCGVALLGVLHPSTHAPEVPVEGSHTAT